MFEHLFILRITTTFLIYVETFIRSELRYIHISIQSEGNCWGLGDVVDGLIDLGHSKRKNMKLFNPRVSGIECVYVINYYWKYDCKKRLNV